MNFWSSDLFLYLLPLIVLPTTAFVICYQYYRGRELDVSQAIALGVPLPLGLGYFLFFSSLRDWFAVTLVFAPQAFVLCAIGAWLLLTQMRGREFSILSSLTIWLVSIFGHLWSIMISGVG